MSRHRKPARGLADRLVTAGLELVLTAGALVLLFVVYQAYVTDWFADQRQDQVAEDLRDEWQDGPPAEPALGEAFLFLHIPRFGDDWNRAVLEGVDPDELSTGPGHYPDSALPGEIGNFALAGHRVGLGSPFLDNDKLGPGDPVVVETADTWFVYRVTGSEIVDPTDTSVVDYPLAGEREGAWLTMTTCHPKFSNRERLVTHALLDSAVAKADEPQGPALLAAGE
ncbi:MAG: class E sortase [Blastococcus sp.]|nr:class E sortase [Blastococcus sp.]